MTYLNIDEVESAIANLATAYPALCSLVQLPSATFEGRISHALRISSAPSGSVDAIVLLGGVHAREWGSCEILVNVATDLLRAYDAGAGLSYGGMSISAATIAQIVDQREVVIYPLANPDGRGYSQANDQNNPNGWRKNRNPASSGGNPADIGVDVNRNYDFLWDFAAKFSPSAIAGNGNLASADPSSLVFHGTGPFSEPESANVKWLADQFPRTRWFVDVHSYSQLILYSWGDDNDQTADASQNFRNSAFDSSRGIPAGLAGGSAYGEFMPAADLAIASNLAAGMRDAIAAVRGIEYEAEQSFGLYGTSGASDDYMFSRNWVNPGQGKIYSFVIEWGTEFHPLWAEMEPIVADISAGLIEFCGATLIPPSCSLVINKGTFGQDEVAAQASWPASYWLEVQGFTNQALGFSQPGDLSHPDPAPALAVTIDAGLNASLTASQIAAIAAHLPSVTVLDPPILADDPTLAEELQTFLYPYTVSFPGNQAFQELNAHQVAVLTLNATLTVGGVTVRATAPLELAKGENPRFEDTKPSSPQEYPTWLSYDLRFFKVTPNAEHQMFGVPNPADATAAYGYIQQVLDQLNSGTVTNGDTFEDTLQQGEDQSALEFLPDDDAGNPTFNFAVARVRVLSSITTTISPVRVFFRMFNAQSTVSSFNESTTYRWGTDGVTPGHKIPLLGVEANQSGELEWVTVPCFAQERVNWDIATGTNTPASMRTQHDDHNARDITTSAGVEVDTYFGCWLDVNQQDQRFLAAAPPAVPSQWDGPWPGTASINSLFAVAPHQCLIAEIRYDDTPVPPGATTGTSDKLAQRNIAWIDGPNPGQAPSRVMPHPFEVRASAASAAKVDELLITWGTSPAGTSASIYLPAVSSADVIALADSMYPSHRLTATDAHTVQCLAGGATLIPVPRGEGRYAGLMSVELPPGIRRGEVYDIVVRQVTQATAAAQHEPAAAKRGPLAWREVLGTFQFTIPISTREQLLYPEERLLAWLKWKISVTPHSLRWHPVLARYAELVAGRVQGFGGKPGQIPASPTGSVPGHHLHPPQPRPEGAGFTGKVIAVRYDRFGDFEGFTLLTEEGHEHSFRGSERAIEKLVGYAWSERVLIAVQVEPHRPEWPAAISLLRG